MKKIIITLAMLSVFACGKEEDKSVNRLAYVDGNYYVYYDNEVVEITRGSYITKDKKIEDYFFNFFGAHVKDEKLLISDLSKYFPHSIQDVVISKNRPDTVVEVPTMDLDGKYIIDSIKLANILSGEDGKALLIVDNTSDIVEIKPSNQIDPEVSLEGKTVDVLNANGINGFAKKLGEAFKNNLDMNYNADNYGSRSDMSYVVNHKLNEDEFLKFVNSIGLKYIKIKEDPSLRPDADVVIITGNDKKVKYAVNIYSTTGVSELKDQLSEYTPKIYKAKESSTIVGVTIKYNPEDFVIAHKLLSLVPSARLEKDSSLENKIVITTNR
ncbi:LytR C-terminal domain-containing protein [Oceanivirga miroungae]|uniref:LytR/CpsA/Psr regulator C-terminal domain-containing protein n=1 Tax=Oceanivirga miroungae TaxID=1130046 RepID=A0A6I8M6U5_9FUSO|nr:LytR C-terminal domain-containing protein [Oceanivirga miroungae]VWL85623.1 hypothetical protein OMES3154_00908 [Oceanivirga miroungae]